MNQQIITSGQKYLDIDAYAGMIAHRELLRAKNIKCYAVSTAPLNQSVPKLIQDLRYKLDQAEISDDADFIMIDVSNPDFFDIFVDLGRITRVIDHHTGYEKFWQEKLGSNAKIEFLGAVCTLIFEEIEREGQLRILDQDLCKLLVAGILDNTLNFLANVTTERDRKAYNKLLEIGRIDRRWKDEYFEACFAKVKSSIAQAINDDLKVERVANCLPEVFGQLIVPQRNSVTREEIVDIFTDYDKWIMNVISLKDGRSYIYFGGDAVEEQLEKLFQKAARDGVIILEKPMLRKEIMKLAREACLQ